ncbi:major histocompatibility complex class I-related gene protein-like isoform X2 [Mugil cephalus]|uniref:major histocompatibility complex class I-related gene protein-like isoform X2 n=1 Tax=Mugil cephalus TaxID=48193 RepID=UPI001FB68C05|nr:major histocompatibility complex class I-related gene protein-like isoform X2 [Mugil cephalus]
MKPLILVLLLGINEVTAVTHSLKYFYTASSGVQNFPQYVSVGTVDDLQISHCDSISKKNVPRQDWMMKVTEEDPQYWEDQTQNCVKHQDAFRANVEIAKQRFNQTGGVHVFQRMYGCEWDDETNEVRGYELLGYDGEDFLSFDLETEQWVAPKPEAFISKMKWDSYKFGLNYLKKYLTQVCPEWLKKYVNYGKSSVMRKALPSVSLLQKTPSSPVSCHATGFYPDRAMMFWRKDGEEIHEGVERGEILPNHDGSFQMKVDLKISSVSPEDWRRYDCVFHLSGVEDDIITKLDVKDTRSNRGKLTDTTTMIIIISLTAVVVVVVLIAAIGVKLHTNKKDKSSEFDSSLKPHVGRVLRTVSESSSGSSVGSVGSNAPLIPDSFRSSDP